MKKFAFIICLFLLIPSLSLNLPADEQVPTAVVEFLNSSDWWGVKMGTHVADMLISKMGGSGYYSFIPRPQIQHALKTRNLPFNTYLGEANAVAIGNEFGSRLFITGKIESIKITKYHRYVPPPRPRPHSPLPPKAPKRYIYSLKVKIKVKIIDVEKDSVIWEGSKSGDATFAKGVLLRPGPSGAWEQQHADIIINKALNKIVKEVKEKTEYLR